MNRNLKIQLAARKYYIIGSVILIIVLYIARLFYLQIIADEYKVYAQVNAFEFLTEYPPRGYIYDRNGKLLVMNEPSYDLMVVPKNAKGCDTITLCEILEITKDEFIKRMKKLSLPPNSPRKQGIFEKQLSVKTYAALQEKMYRFKGFYVQVRSIRKYPKPIAAHALGYVGEVSKAITEKDPYYKEGDYIGISGIERSYEKYLRGKKGTRIIIRDVHNREVGSFMDGKYDTLAIPGEPLYSSLDVELQEYGEYLMQNKKGSIVAIDPSTGEILCLVSSPSYDPNMLVGGKERRRNFAKLYADTINVPLFNRATQAMYPPGSTFKLIDALIGQKDSVLFAHTVYPCIGGYPPMGGKPKCHPHPTANLEMSIQYSCNSYYSYVFKSIVENYRKWGNFRNAYNHWREAVMSFGIGKKLNYDIPYEKPGNVPSIPYYDKVFGQNRWYASTVISLGIGQAELTAVPIQLANVMCIIANRGFYYTPHIIKGIGKRQYLDSSFTVKHYAYVTEKEYYEHVINGMEKVVEAGTARLAKIKDIKVCGKTGTAQNPHGKDHALFFAFAPKENPKIAISVIVENAGFGGVWAAPIASLMIEKYLTGKISRPDLEKRMVEANLIKANIEYIKSGMPDKKKTTRKSKKRR